MERVDAALVVPIIDQWVTDGGTIDSLHPSLARCCRRLRSGKQTSMEIGALDRLLIALAQPPHLLAELVPVVPRSTGAGYFWPKHHPLRKLTDEQVKAAHTLHVAGMSMRELGRQMHERYGYSSAKSCTQALSDAFRRAGLSRRDRIEATIAASTVHGRGARKDTAAYKRWHRATYGPWPSDRKQAAA